MKLSFHGADRDVTGSCHLLDCAGKRILIDCGMLQGSRELDQENAGNFGFEPAQIDYLLLTHAHLDHCGRLPLLVRRGFRGEVITTAASRELARLVLLDAAHLQEEDARRAARTQMRRDGGAPAAPLYTQLDVLSTLDRFGRVAEYGKQIQVAAGITATFLDAGHILGSASVLLELEENGKRKSIVFSGDLGNADRPLFRAPEAPAQADIVVMESTYGDRKHRAYQDFVNELYQAITETFARGGNVIIPTFALERAQEILFAIRQGIEAKRLPPTVLAFLDSPMAVSATQVFERHPESFTPDIAKSIAAGQHPFQFPGLHMTSEVADSIAINRVTGGAVIMAGAGMCTGGRVRHHLKHNLWRPQSSVVFVGYAAAGTPARQLIDGAKRVRLLDEDIAVRATIHTINGFSAHAGQDGLLAWHQHIQGKSTTFLVHGEETVMHVLAGLLTDTHVEIPALHQSFDL